MGKLWLRKMIWSYIPLFLIVFSFLFFIFFQVLVDQNHKNTKASSEVFTAQVLQSVDVSLKTVDHMVIRELLNNKLLASFFEQKQDGDVYLNYEVLKRLSELKQEVPLIDSFYLYRYSDGTIFSSNMLTKIHEFEDEEFLRSITGRAVRQQWTNLRSYRELLFQTKKQVVSIAHEVPINSGTQGIFVINIDVSQFRSAVSFLYNQSSTFVNIIDGAGQPIYSDNSQLDRKVMASLKSDYTGWTFESGINNGLLVSAVQAFSSIWFAVGVLVFAGGLVLIIYISRANYKPLEELVVKLNLSLFEGGRSAGSLAADEFTFIESAINNFAAQSKLAEKEFSKVTLLKRKNAFNFMIFGDHADEELSERPPFEGLQMPAFIALTVLVIEVDNPEQTFFTYSGRDRSLFKFVLSSVVNEMVQLRDMSVWLEWTSPVHLTGIVFQQDINDLTEVYEAIVGWAAKNLKFTVTIGVGRLYGSLQGARVSYEEACSLLNFKAVLGTNRIIRYSDAENPQQKEEHEHLQNIHELSSTFRLGDEQWKSHYISLFEGIRTSRPTKPEIVKLMNYMLAYLGLHLSRWSKEEYECWQQTLEEARFTVESFDTLDELSQALYSTMDHCWRRLEEIRTSRSHHRMMQDVREFIERDYANPDMSLDYLCDKFSINAKYLSRLFKEALGENFLDFLMSVRIRSAKENLLKGETSIQEVGEKVGYPNAATFRRVFRKMEGISPQDFRNRMQSGQDDNGRT